MTAGVGFAEISILILIENIIAEIKEQYLTDETLTNRKRQKRSDAPQ